MAEQAACANPQQVPAWQPSPARQSADSSQTCPTLPRGWQVPPRQTNPLQHWLLALQAACCGVQQRPLAQPPAAHSLPARHSAPAGKAPGWKQARWASASPTSGSRQIRPEQQSASAVQAYRTVSQQRPVVGLHL
ncbi:MAG: hypothetical protein DCC58_08740 [Chloroflexi bacterium]|nr:MAG: hypothetical protein DCC58_08740 [Chloroflexota bacterium]